MPFHIIIFTCLWSCALTVFRLRSFFFWLSLPDLPSLFGSRHLPSLLFLALYLTLYPTLYQTISISFSFSLSLSVSFSFRDQITSRTRIVFLNLQMKTSIKSTYIAHELAPSFQITIFVFLLRFQVTTHSWNVACCNEFWYHISNYRRKLLTSIIMHVTQGIIRV